MYVPVPMPTRGVDENLPKGNQRPDTARDAQNVRSLDPITGRSRIAQREGHTKFAATDLGGEVYHVKHLTYDSKAILYSELFGELDAGANKLSVEWSQATSSGSDAVAMTRDSQGNLYVVAGKTIEKRSPGGELLWAFPIPVASDDMVLGSIDVGDDLAIYVGVSGGDDQVGAAIYRVRQKQIANSFDTEPVLSWELTTDRWVRDLVVRQSTLVTLEQDDDTYSAFAFTYIGITAPDPLPSSIVRVPYPATCFAVKDDGSILSAHPSFADRDSNPQSPGTTLPLEDWNLTDLPNWKKRLWSHFTAESILEVTQDEGDIYEWRDQSGNGRHWTAATNADLQIQKKSKNNFTAIPEGSTPQVKHNRLAGKPGVYMNGQSAFISAPGGGTEATSSKQLSAVPNFSDGAYCIFIVCRPELGDIGGGKAENQRRYLFFQRHNLQYHASHVGYTSGAKYAYASEFLSGIALNSAVASATNPYTFNHYLNDNADENWEGSFSSGAIRPFTSFIHRTGTTKGASGDLNIADGTYGFPLEGSFLSGASGTATNACIITMLHDGGLDSYYEEAGQLVGSVFTADSVETPFVGYRLTSGDVATLTDASGTLVYTGTVTAKSSSTVTLSASGLPADGAYTVKVTPQDRDCLTRSLMRVNGKPVDRWESLSMQVSGTDGTNLLETFEIPASPTLLGYVFQPEAAANMHPYFGDIYEIVVIGRRTTGSDFSEPTVLTHPMFGVDGSDQRGPTGNDDQQSGATTTSFWGSAASNQTSSEMEKIEGYLAHRWGIADLLPKGPVAAGSFPHVHSREPDNVTTFDLPQSSTLQTGAALITHLRSSSSMVVKQSPAGNLIYCLPGMGTSGAPSKDINGLSYSPVTEVAGLAIRSDGDYYFVGRGTGEDGIAMAGKVTDVDTLQEVSDLKLAVTHWWDSTQTVYPYTGGTTGEEHACLFPSDEKIHMAVDAWDSLLVPIPPGATSANYDLFEAARYFGPDGDFLCRISTLEHGSSKYQNAYAVSFPSIEPLYDSLDFATSGIKRSEFAYLAMESDNNSTTDPADGLAKFRTAKADVTSNTPRGTRFLAVAGGVLYSKSSGSWSSITGVSFASNLSFFDSTVHQQKLYLTDGSTYGVYDAREETLEPWVAKGAGEMPDKLALLETWRDRIVGARGAGDPHNWHMSASGDPTDWNNFPPVPNNLQAISGNNAKAGLCPDIINAVVPYNDDLLIFGCDSSIWRLTGDPMTGGEFDLISDVTGMAFGRPWCKDPSGMLYFFGSKGGVFAMPPGGIPKHLSDVRDGATTSVERRLRDIDLSLYRVELVWDHDNGGLRLYLIPFAAGNTVALEHWFWSQKSQAWWPDSFSDSAHQPYAVTVFDGDDPDDRAVVLGCQDGYTRKVDRTAKDDDSAAIYSWVTIGPLRAKGDVELKLHRLRGILDELQDGTRYEIYVSNDGNDLGDPVSSGTLDPGMGPTQSIRRRGSSVWIKLGNYAAGERWALEELLVQVVAGGRRRVR